MAVCRGLIRNGAFEWLFMAGNSDWPPSSLVAYISSLNCMAATMSCCFHTRDVAALGRN